MAEYTDENTDAVAGVVDSLIERLVHLRASGVAELRVPRVSTEARTAPSPSADATAPSAPADATAPAPSPQMKAPGRAPAPPDASAGAKVPGAGPAGAPVAFVGGAPDEGSAASPTPYPEDGEEGALLTRMINAMGLGREAVYISYVVKQALPGGREPTDAELAENTPALVEELAAIRPGVVVAFGAAASLALIGSSDVAGLRGRFHEQDSLVVMPTYSPELMVMDPALKGPVWKDLQAVMKRLGLSAPPPAPAATGRGPRSGPSGGRARG